jgi:tetratricopeptide (TPR) repeat protein
MIGLQYEPLRLYSVFISYFDLIHMIPFRLYLLFFAWIFGSTLATAQFEKAHSHFSKKEYAKAIVLYEQGLKEKESLLAKTRLAQCYQVLNRMVQAESLLSEVVKDPKAKPITYKHYAETLMSNGKYDEAKTWFLQYFQIEGKDSSALAMATACDQVGTIKPYFTNALTEPAPFNSEADDHLAAFSPDGLIFTSDRTQDLALLKEKSGATGRDYLKLWTARYQTDQWTEPEHFSNKVNDLNVNTAGIGYDKSGRHLVFSRNNAVTSKKGEYKMHLFCATSNEKGKIGKPDKLDFCNDELNYMHPTLSAHANMLIFSSDSKGEGGMDLFVSYRRKDKWSVPRNLGNVINTNRHEAFPYLHSDGRLFFASKGHQGFGGFDIFVSNYDSTAQSWTTPVNLGQPINSPSDDISFTLAPSAKPDTAIGTFTSTRGSGNDDIYFFWQNSAQQPNWARAFVVATDTIVAAQAVAEATEIATAVPSTTTAPRLDLAALNTALNTADQGKILAGLRNAADQIKQGEGVMIEIQTPTDELRTSILTAIAQLADTNAVQQFKVTRSDGNTVLAVIR